MQTPPTISFHGFQARPELKELVERQIATLERRYDRITTVRVVVDAPHHRGRKGATFDVRIEVGVPGGTELVVNHRPGRRERHTEPGPAIRDAFAAASRRIDTWLAKVRGRVKTHEQPALGTVVRLDIREEFGFVSMPDGREIYFTAAALQDASFDDLAIGTRVTLVEGDQGVEGPMATTVRIV